MILNRVFADSEEKFSKAVVLYGQASDDYVYADEAFTTKIAKDDLVDLATKGVVVSYDGAYYTPLTFGPDSTDAYATLTIATVASSTITCVVLASEEYSE